MDSLNRRASREFARRNAKRRWENTTAAERSKVARDLDAARWGTKKPAAQKAPKGKLEPASAQMTAEEFGLALARPIRRFNVWRRRRVIEAIADALANLTGRAQVFDHAETVRKKPAGRKLSR